MKVGCVRCNKVFESLVIEPEIAWKDIFTEVQKHVVKKHPKFNQKILDSATKAQITIFSYIVITQTTLTTEDNKWLDKRIGQMRDVIMRLIGYEPIEEEEETQEEEQEEENNNKEEEETPIFEEAD